MGGSGEETETETDKGRPSLLIAGAEGNQAHRINGVWDRAEVNDDPAEAAAGLPVYFKRGAPRECLSYYASKKWWIVGLRCDRGTGRGCAYVFCCPEASLDMCPNPWTVWVLDAWVHQPSFQLTWHEEA